jgi:DNA-binding transcriptional ArsR family regulator
MSNPNFASHARSKDAIIESIADRTRRETLRALLGWPTGMATEDLATLVTAAISDGGAGEATREARGSVHVALVHTHLPRLADAGLVERDVEAGTVATTDHPALRDDRFQKMLAVEADDWDQVLTALQAPKQRTALAVLEEVETLDTEELARRIVARETDSAPTDVPDDAIEETLVALHHVHIPTIQQAGLVAAADETVRYIGHSDLESEWLDFQSSASTTGEPLSREA